MGLLEETKRDFPVTYIRIHIFEFLGFEESRGHSVNIKITEFASGRDDALLPYPHAQQ